ncbi:unnamed protein product [Nippostrongylus brasiliensis]|uniref:Remorin_C domain-containing protein n=1 Tax=Nippostrongylus brasiliensis TaxID=27835 RepID=A0A0N4YH07_NIPBR|nr:unnamed protein product [Nippostrongylus brasiliensis]
MDKFENHAQLSYSANSPEMQRKQTESRQQGDRLSPRSDEQSNKFVCSRNGNTSAKQDDGYTPMHAAEWSAVGSGSHLILPPYEQYKLEEVRSYVSDSSDSCYSSLAANGCGASQTAVGTAANPPRAYSFAGRCNLHHGGLQGGVVEGADLRENSVAGGLIPPPEDPRKRAFSLGSKTLFTSGSFGSSRSTPFNKRGGSSGVRDGADHFVEMDFGNAIGRSGSGSVASVDSPNRSRTSSFGCSVRKDAEVFSFPTDLPESGLTPSQIVLQQAKQNSLDVDQKAIDLRSSQHFETIQESASLKSSPCSSSIKSRIRNGGIVCSASLRPWIAKEEFSTYVKDPRSG